MKNRDGIRTETFGTKDGALEHLRSRGCALARSFYSGSQIWDSPRSGRFEVLYQRSGWIVRKSWHNGGAA